MFFPGEFFYNHTVLECSKPCRASKESYFHLKMSSYCCQSQDFCNRYKGKIANKYANWLPVPLPALFSLVCLLGLHAHSAEDGATYITSKHPSLSLSWILTSYPTSDANTLHSPLFPLSSSFPCEYHHQSCLLAFIYLAQSLLLWL